MKHLMKNYQLKLNYSDPFETNQKADTVNVHEVEAQKIRKRNLLQRCFIVISNAQKRLFDFLINDALILY